MCGERCSTGVDLHLVIQTQETPLRPPGAFVDLSQPIAFSASPSTIGAFQPCNSIHKEDEIWKMHCRQTTTFFRTRHAYHAAQGLREQRVMEGIGPYLILVILRCIAWQIALWISISSRHGFGKTSLRQLQLQRVDALERHDLRTNWYSSTTDLKLKRKKKFTAATAVVSDDEEEGRKKDVVLYRGREGPQL